MAEEIYAAIKKVQTIVGALSGIRLAPQDPTETAGAFPFAISYLGTDRVTIGPPGVMEHQATLICELHVARANLPVDVQTLMPFADSIPNALWDDPTLGATVTSLREIRCRFAPLDYGSTKTIGFRFEIDVKIMVNVT